jgi:hypothetical protein
VIPPLRAVGQTEQARAKVAERVDEQPGGLYLGEAEPPVGIGLAMPPRKRQSKICYSRWTAHPSVWRGPALLSTCSIRG